jgi:hypothetical protein
MKTKRITNHATATILTGMFVLLACRAAAAAEPPSSTPADTKSAPAGTSWFADNTPQLGAYTGFICEPRAMHEFENPREQVKIWSERIGKNFDADQWAEHFVKIGCDYMYLYAKWIDGLCFWDTKTTDFKTKRDFCGEMADACHRYGLRIGWYWNHVCDGNPEFDKWNVFDPNGRPTAFGGTRYCFRKTPASPFRDVSLRQLSELFTNYGTVSCMWFDLPGLSIYGSNEWKDRLSTERYGFSYLEATPKQRQDLLFDLHDAYFRDAVALRDELQPECSYSRNDMRRRYLNPRRYSKMMNAYSDHLTAECHKYENMEQFSRLAAFHTKPAEAVMLVSDSWYIQPEGVDDQLAMTEKGAIATVAAGLCQGVNVALAMTPNHDGIFPPDVICRTKKIGDWFRSVRPVLAGANPHADVAIVLGAVEICESDFPTPTQRYYGELNTENIEEVSEAFKIGDALSRAGVFSRILLKTESVAQWPESLSQFAAIVLPEFAPLDDEHVGRLREYVRQGGTLVAFERAGALNGVLTKGPDCLENRLSDVLGTMYFGDHAFATPVSLVPVARDWPAMGSVRHAVRAYRPASAGMSVVVQYNDGKNTLAISRKSFGKGLAFAVTAPSTSFDKNDPFWDYLRHLAVGDKTVVCEKAETSDRYFLVSTEIGDRSILHAIDRTAVQGMSKRGSGPLKPKPEDKFRAEDLTLSLHASRLGDVKQAHLVGSGEPLTLKHENGYVTFTVRPDPVASVVLK